MKADDIQLFTSAVVASGSLFVREAARLFKPFGISVPQFDALELLSNAPRGLRQNELAGSLVVDPSSTTYLLDVLEKRKWVRRTDDREDRRALRIVITPQGRAIHARAGKAYRAGLEYLATVLPAEDVAAATRLLQALPAAAAAAARHAAETVRPPGEATA